MWLALDIGNSALKGAFFDGQTLVRTFRMDIDPTSTSTLWETHLISVLEGTQVESIGIASVVPGLAGMVEQVLFQITGIKPFILSWQVELPFKLGYETPQTLGIDRLAAAAGAWIRFGSLPDKSARNVIVIDAGTALTYEVIERSGVYLGGVISPGPRLSLRALNQGTAQLPAVDPEIPDRLIGRSTREGIRSGVMYGFIDGVAGMLRRLDEQLSQPTFIVATGGWSTFLNRHLHSFGQIEPDLVLIGIYELMRLNLD